jgi:protein-disulfide isomerase
MPLLMENYDGYIRYVYRDFAGVGGQNAVQAGMAAQCANDQGKFWEYHDYLYQNQQALSTSNVNSVLISDAGALGLDVATFTECLESNRYLDDVNQDRAVGVQNGVGGTPTFFINGLPVVGAQPYASFASVIDSELARLGVNREVGG